MAKKILKTIIIILLIIFCTYMVYVHRRAIRAWLKGVHIAKLNGRVCGAKRPHSVS